MNAMISLFLNIPFPEQLDDETFIDKYLQVKWLGRKGLLGVKGIK